MRAAYARRRDPDGLLRPGRVPRPAARPARAVPRDPPRLAGRGARAGRGFADQMASAIGNARLYDSTVDLAARLRAIQDLTCPLNRIQDVRGIAEAIVAEARSLIDHDNIRVYRVDDDDRHVRADRLPGRLHGRRARRRPRRSAAEIGEGLTGWAAEHGETLVIGDAGRRSARTLVIGPPDGPESMLARPDALRRPGPRASSSSRPSSVATGSAPTTRRPCRSSPASPPRRSSTPTTPSGSAASSTSSSISSRSQRRLLEVNETLALDARPARGPRADRRRAQVARRLRLADDLPDRPRGAASGGRRGARPVRRRDPRLRRRRSASGSPAGSSPQRGGPRQRRPSRPTHDPDPGHAVRA